MATDSEATPAGAISRASSPSDSSDSDSSSPSTSRRDTPTEWLATARSKRATAGNRMKSMLANEEPDSDMELLFAEDDDDQGFTDVGDNASDVQMDSSSDEEDNAAGADDDMEGEKELERQAKEKKAAQRKRKAQEAIPAKFRKKVRIDSTGSRAAAPAPAPRPKKKSERASWLPTAADAPTRASSRSTTKLSKEALHLQMEEREARRLKQIKQMEKQAAKRKALEKPPMTQAERLREAEIVERRNSKSLNRWEVAEKQREEERKAKLAALNERTLRGPVITFWSGTREWKDGGLKSFAVLEEKPKRYQRKKKDKEKEMASANVEGQTTTEGTSQDLPTQSNAEPPPGQPGPETGVENGPAKDQDGDTAMEGASQPVPEPTAATAPEPPEAPSGMAMPQGPTSGLAAPAPAPSPVPSPSTEPHTSSVLAPPSLAPPTGITTNGNIPSPLEAPKLNVLAQPKPESSDNSPATPKSTEPFIQARLHLIEPDTPVSKPSAPPSEAPEQEPKPTTSTREAIIYQNFDNNALKDKSIQTQILFGRKMNKLGKPPAHPVCVITHHPARYRDPDTGLPFFNSYAYREIQRLKRGEYRFSGLLGAWVGAGRHAAQGVPERFLHPEAKGPKQLEKERKEEQEKKRKEEEAKEETDVKAEAADGPKVEDAPAPLATESLEAGEAKG